MTEKKFRIVHYLNQFFGGIGGEDKAGTPPFVKEGTVGPGEQFFKKLLGDEAEIVATIICGDNYFAENPKKACQELLGLAKQLKPGGFIAGPSFNAGRYCFACGEIGKAVSETLKIPVVAGMYYDPENPEMEKYKKFLYIVKTRKSVAGMPEAAPAMANIALKLLNGEELLPEKERYIPQGFRKNYLSTKTGAERAVAMLIQKLKRQDFQTELKMPKFDEVEPLTPVVDLSKIKIALVTSGGIVPKGNPDKIESSSASHFGRYNLKGLETISTETHQTAHGGYDPTYANENPNRVLPVDVMRDLEGEKFFGELYEFYYATVGNGTSVENAKKFGEVIAKELAQNGVQAALITSN